MGTWGPGGFENDAAADVVAGLSTVDDIAAVFADIPADQTIELDADVAACVIAAAECVAGMLGNPAPDMPAKLAKAIATFGKPDHALVEAARNAVSRVLRHSELTELWAETDAAPFNRAITSLIARLGPPASPKKKTKPSVSKAKAGKPKPVLQTCSFCNGPIDPSDLFLFEITEMGAGEVEAAMRRGAWCHLACLNAALHPKHLVQNWKFDPEEIEREAKKLLGR